MSKISDTAKHEAVIKEGVDTTLGVDNEQREYSLHINEDIDFHVFTPINETYATVIVWENNGYSFKIQGEYDYEELLKVAFSIKEK